MKHLPSYSPYYHNNCTRGKPQAVRLKSPPQNKFEAMKALQLDGLSYKNRERFMEAWEICPGVLLKVNRDIMIAIDRDGQIDSPNAFLYSRLKSAKHLFAAKLMYEFSSKKT